MVEGHVAWYRARMTEPVDPDAAARRSLARHRALATSLLVLMAALVVASYALPPSYAADLLQASAKAGVVGGLADWFAITALFRRPLGLPIPHTAIIPRQKERLGRSLGRFVANHVFTTAEVSRILDRIDVAGLLHRFLADATATRPAAEAMAGMLPRLLATLEDGRARRLAARVLPRLVGGPGAGLVVARALRGLMEGGRHQEVLGFVLAELRSTLSRREGALRTAIEARVGEQGGKLVGWALGASIARRVLGTMNAELERMGPDNSEMRQAFDEWARREIEKMETDPERAAEIGRALRGVVAHETVQAWLWDVWARLRGVMEADAAQPGGRSVAIIEQALANLGALMDRDPAARARVQAAAEAIAGRLLPAAQAHLADFIGDVVTSWDSATIVDKLELRVGRDLQYVRMNGTLVGFLAGGVLYALLREVMGRVAF
jgi:uncharacterized membrane-anchored protein YjiN (DUF445 family)